MLRLKLANCGVKKIALVVKMLRLKVLREHSPGTRSRILNRGMVIKKQVTIGIDICCVTLQLATCDVEKFSVIVELLRLKVCRERKKRCVDVAVACPLRYFKDQT